MAGSMKKVFIIGNVGRDPETRYTSDGTQVASFSVAVSERARRSQGAEGGPAGQGEETTTWFRVSAWRRQAEIVMQYVKKGSSVFVSGRLSTSEFTDKDGKNRTSLEVSMEDMQLLTPKGMEEQGGGGSFDSAPSYGGNRGSTGQGGSSGSRKPATDVAFEDEGDIPF